MLLLLNAGAPTAIAQQAAPSLATVISNDGLNLRGAPTTVSPIIATIPFASVVTLTGAPTPDNWYPLSFGSLSGWSLGDYLTGGAVDPLLALTAPPLSRQTSAPAWSTTSGAGGPSLVPPVSPPAATTAGSQNAVITTPLGPPYQATATYYGVDDGAVAGQIMACGAPFNPYDAGAAATNDWPCGTHLHVTGPDGRSITVTVTDHGAYPAHWIDLTYAAFGLLANHAIGTMQVTIQHIP